MAGLSPGVGGSRARSRPAVGLRGCRGIDDRQPDHVDVRKQGPRMNRKKVIVGILVWPRCVLACAPFRSESTERGHSCTRRPRRINHCCRRVRWLEQDRHGQRDQRAYYDHRVFSRNNDCPGYHDATGSEAGADGLISPPTLPFNCAPDCGKSPRARTIVPNTSPM